MPQNDKDYAVVIGIKDYPAFDTDNPLTGPENDARAFHDWLISADGGDVPSANVELIISSKFGPPFADAKSARPIVNEIQIAFENLQDIAARNEATGDGYRVGRRLYIYMSGHGFAPTFEETGLLMANATPERVGATYHVLGQYTADWFFKARCFEEVFLFMDCCREVFPVQGFNKSFKELNASGAITQVKRFYGLATMWSGVAKEKDIDGMRRGVFTDALIKGLKGSACNPNTGNLTALSLKNFIYTAMDGVSGDDTQLTDPALKPEMKFYPEINEGFLIKKTKVPEFDVKINFPPPAVGQDVQILDGADIETVIKSASHAPAVWQVELKRGKYLILVVAAGLKKVIHVDGTGGLDVSF
ncbi:MAG: caspase family protein [Acidobacteriota bacterium]|nr:caspase family protein [Acidobacteriota bacterium]